MSRKEYILIIEIPHQYTPKAWITTKDGLIEIAEKSRNGRGESLVTSYYREDLNEYRDNELHDLVAAFGRLETNEIYEIENPEKAFETIYTDTLPEGYEFNQAVEEILHDNHSAWVCETKADLNHALEWDGHGATQVKRCVAEELKQNDWFELPA